VLQQAGIAAECERVAVTGTLASHAIGLPKAISIEVTLEIFSWLICLFISEHPPFTDWPKSHKDNGA
jgi:hypothetical protein